jgi:heparan-alpha-glucosaminide N-acetyltransferase
LRHVITRTLALLLIGILMVNGEGHPNAEMMGVSGDTWTALMFTSAMLAFCSISPPRWANAGEGTKKTFRLLTGVVRALGFAGLIWAAVVFRGGNKGTRIISLEPFSIHHSWYGILGLIGWAYLVAAICFLLFRTNRTALLGCVAILLCFFIADKKGFFEGFFLNDVVGIGEALGSLASISVAGVVLGSILLTPDAQTVKARTGFTLLFIVGFAFAAMLLAKQWGISKNNATPAWCLWSCAITAALWLLFYLAADVHQLTFLAKPFAIAGENVLLAYILSEMMYSVLDLVHLGNWYGSLSGPTLANAIARSVGCSIFVLLLTAGLNRLGFRLKL